VWGGGAGEWGGGGGGGRVGHARVTGRGGGAALRAASRHGGRRYIRASEPSTSLAKCNVTLSPISNRLTYHHLRLVLWSWCPAEVVASGVGLASADPASADERGSAHRQRSGGSRRRVRRRS